VPRAEKRVLLSWFYFVFQNRGVPQTFKRYSCTVDDRSQESSFPRSSFVCCSLKCLIWTQIIVTENSVCVNILIVIHYVKPWLVTASKCSELFSSYQSWRYGTQFPNFGDCLCPPQQEHTRQKHAPKCRKCITYRRCWSPAAVKIIALYKILTVYLRPGYR
jgi:hypothetical protein